MDKSVCYYYKATNDKDQTVFRCLFDGRYDIVEKKSLDIHNCKNFRLNANYNATDEDLIQYRDDFKEFNAELRKPFFKNGNMMKKVRVPESAPIFYVMEEEDLNFERLDFGFYRVRVNCTHKDFGKVFNFNKTHHYSHNTLKLLYKFGEKYDITFTLLPPDKEYNYNMIHYEKTVELKTLLRGWFKVMDTLLKQCSKKNFLVKTLVSQAYGTLSKYRKIYVKQANCKEYDWEHLKNINNTDRYEYYCKEYENGVFTMVEAKNAYTHGGIARIKSFLTEYARGFVFNMLSEHNLAKDVVRVHTDGICFRRLVDFKALTGLFPDS